MFQTTQLIGDLIVNFEYSLFAWLNARLASFIEFFKLLRVTSLDLTAFSNEFLANFI